ncbi:MAG: hypothetical protein RBT71_08495 [Flavobacteriales bacterium]|jgi:hypothetical protein|nr:hypothetical protein [Flavobacteriales bacterium]
MPRRAAYLLLLSLLMAGTGCYYDNEEALYPGVCEVGEPALPGYWATTVQPLIMTRCAVAGCHVAGGTGTGDFTQYANVKSAVDNGTFQYQVFTARTMPTTGPLPACEIQKLEAWVHEGASDQ